MTKVFVYGTLMSGMGASDFMPKDGFIGNATIKGKLYHLGGFPGVKLEGDDVVHGEVYEVDNATLAMLDGYEGYYKDDPEGSLYLRKTTQALLREGDVVDCVVNVYEYNGDVSTRQLIESGDYRRA